VRDEDASSHILAGRHFVFPEGRQLGMSTSPAAPKVICLVVVGDYIGLLYCFAGSAVRLKLKHGLQHQAAS
jgi:hypothetical protein